MVIIVLIELIYKTNKVCDVLTIASKHDMRVIFMSLPTRLAIKIDLHLIRSLSFHQILYSLHDTILLFLRNRLFKTDFWNWNVLLRNLLFWKRRSVLQIEPENFPNSLVFVCNVLLSPRWINEACVWISPEYFVCKPVLLLIYITNQINVLAKLRQTF